MSDLWGYAAGQQQAVQDNQKTQLFNLSLLEGQQSLQEGAVKLEAQKLALDNAKVMKDRQEHALKLFQLSQANASKSDDPTKNVTDTLYRLAQSDFESQLPEQGVETLKTAAQLQENHLRIVDQQTSAQIKRFTAIADLAKDVHNAEDWNRAKMLYQSEFPDKLAPELQGPYNPKLVQQLATGAQTALQKAQEQRINALKTNEATVIKLNELRENHVKALTELAKTRKEAIEKAGGGNLLPKSTDITAISDLITTNYPDVPKDQARTLAQPIAEKAKGYEADGMKPSQAYKKAFQEAKASGDFWGLRSVRQRAGTSAEVPLDLPLKDGKPDISQMRPNMFYKVPGKQGSYVYDKEAGGLRQVLPPGNQPPEEDDESEAEDET